MDKVAASLVSRRPLMDSSRNPNSRQRDVKGRALFHLIRTPPWHSAAWTSNPADTQCAWRAAQRARANSVRSDCRRTASAAPPCLSARPPDGHVAATEHKSSPDFGGFARLQNSIARQRTAFTPEKKPVATKRPRFCGHRRAQKCVHRKELVAAAESKSSRGHEMQSTSRTTFF